MTSVVSLSTTLVGDGRNKQLQSSNRVAEFTASPAPTTF